MSDKPGNDGIRDDIEVLCSNMSSKEQFLELLRLLRMDFVENKGRWENQALEAYLAGMEAFARDMQGYYDNFNIPVDSNIPSWRVFADILLGARIYD